MAGGRTHRRTTEDLYFSPVGGPEDYAYTTDKPVQYVTVANDSDVLGYLWAADTDDAAGFEPRPAAGGDAFNAGVAWTEVMREAKGRALRPSQMLTRYAVEQGSGRMVPGSNGQASSLSELKDLAARG